MRFPQIGEGGFIPHDPKSRMGLIEASEVAWQVGQVNAAQRFAFVGVLSSQRCVQPRLMKRLVETYLVTGEYRAAEKYIKILESNPHYRDWATAQRPLLDSVACASEDWIAAKRAMLPITDNPLDLTLIFPNALAFLIDDHADNRPAFEYGMGYLLVYKDLMTFMHYMELMKERGEAFPVLYQEAICLFFAAVQKDPEAFRSFPISQEVQNRFLQFMKVARSMPPAALKQQFGDTYYYYAQFTDFLVLDNISSPIRRTHMEHHLPRISHTERMAVHTIIASHIVTDNRLFVKRLQIPLINTHNMPFLVSRLYQTVY